MKNDTYLLASKYSHTSPPPMPGGSWLWSLFITSINTRKLS